MCLFVTRFDFLGFFSPQNKLVEWIQLIVINLIYSSSENLMDSIHKVSVKNPYDFSHLIQDKLQHLQIGWLEKEKGSYSCQSHICIFLWDRESGYFKTTV